MAIAYDATTLCAKKTSSPFTWTHTVGSGNNMLLLIGISLHVAGEYGSYVSSASFNGVAMTKVRSNLGYSIIQRAESSMWALHNPTVGAHTVSVSVSGPFSARGASVSYSGCKQTSTLDASNGTSGNTGGSTGGIKSFTLTTVEDNCWTACIGAYYGEEGCGVDEVAPMISRASGTFDNVADIEYADSNAPNTPAGANIISMDVEPDAIAWALTGVSFAPAPTSQFFARRIGFSDF